MTIGRKAVNTHPASDGGRCLHGRGLWRSIRFHAIVSRGWSNATAEAVRGAL